MFSDDDENFYEADDYMGDYEDEYSTYPDYYYESSGDQSRSNARRDEQLKYLISTAISEKKFVDLKNLIDSSYLSLKIRFHGLCHAVSCDQIGAAKLMLQSTLHLINQVKNQFYSAKESGLVLSVHQNESVFRFHEFFLALAVDKSDKKVVKLLLNDGANVHFKIKYNNYGKPLSCTSILIAVENTNVQIVEQLLIHGADANSRYLQSAVYGHKGCTLLHVAVKNRSKPIIKLLLLYGADINAIENNGLTPLHLAAQTRQFEIMKYLTKERVYINPAVATTDEKYCRRINKYKRNLLADYVHLATNLCYNELPLITLNPTAVTTDEKYCRTKNENKRNLLANYVDLASNLCIGTHLIIEKGHTSLDAVPRLTVETRCPEVVAYVLDRYPDANDENNRDVLFSAIFSMGTENDKNILAKLLQYEFQSSTYSVQYEDINILAELLPDEFQDSMYSAGYEPSLNSGGKNSSDLLFDAVRGNFFDTVELLLKNGAEVNKKYNGNDPYFEFCSSLLHVAVIMGDIRMIKLLMDYEADLDARKHFDGKTPLLFAVALSDSEIASLLLKNGAKIFDKELLILAVEKSSIEVIKILLQKDININQEAIFEKKLCETLSYSRSHGRLPQSHHNTSYSSERPLRTALHVAADLGRYEVVKLLLNYGAGASCNRYYNETPLYFSTCKGHFETVKLLLENGANLTDRHARSAFHEAAKAGHCEVVKLMIESGIEIDTEDEAGNTPLLNSIEARRWEVIEVLLRFGANFQKCTRTHLSALDIAIKNADDKAVKLLLEHGAKGSESRYFKSSIAIFTTRRRPEIVELLLKSGADITTSNWWGGSVLSTAAEMDSEELVKLLLKYGSDAYEIGDYVEPLLIGAEKGNVKIIERLLKSSVCINSVNKEGQTALFKAAEQGQTETVQALLKYGASVNCKTFDGETPLLVSVRKGHLDIVQVLLKSNADIDSTDNRGRSPIYNAAREGHVEIVRQLLQHGAAVDIRNIDDETPLLISADRGHLDIVETLLKFTADVDSMDKNGKSPLYKAAENGYVEIVKRLLKCGAATDIKATDGGTPLLVSADKGYFDIVEILIKYKAEINSADENGKTPLYIAVKQGQLEIVKLLMEHGAATETRTAAGETPLSTAIDQDYWNSVRICQLEEMSNLTNSGMIRFESGKHYTRESIQQVNTEIMQLLLEHGAAVDYENGKGETPLIISMEQNNILLSKTLLRYGASIESTNLDGEKPLHLAAKHSDFERTKLLLEHGADVDAKKWTGETPLLISLARSGLKVMKALLEAGANINSMDSSGRTPLFFAVLGFQNEAVKLLLDYGADIDSKTLGRVKSDGLEYRSGPFIVCHIVKMREANIYKGKDFNDIVNDSGRPEIVEFQKKCMVQVTKMKDEYIADTEVTFYEILTKNLEQLARFAKNNSVAEILKKGDHRVKFPIYADNIEIQIQKGEIRKNLMERGIKVYNFLINQYTDLPYELMEKLLGYLGNNDLRMLIHSCKPILASLPSAPILASQLSASLENLDLFDMSED